MSDNTITSTPNTLTPERLREVLDQWCEEQPGVLCYAPESDIKSSAWQMMANIPEYEEYGDRWWDFADDNENDLDSPDVQLIHAETFLALVTLAHEHRYLPWLRLAATLPYTGAKAAQLALDALAKPKPLGGVLGQVRQDLRGRIDIAGVE